VKIIQTHPFFQISKIFSLPLHIKAEYHEINGDCCRFNCIKFPKSAIEELKAGILLPSDHKINMGPKLPNFRE